MPELIRLAARRREIIEEIDAIKSMRKGTLNTRYNKVTNKKGEEVLNGPYYVLTKKGTGNKTISAPIPAADAVRVQGDVDNYKRFRQLTDEYTDVCEKLAQFTGNEDECKKTEFSIGVRRRNQSVRCERGRKDGIRGINAVGRNRDGGSGTQPYAAATPYLPSFFPT